MPPKSHSLRVAVAAVLAVVAGLLTLSSVFVAPKANAYPPDAMVLEIITSSSNEVAQIGFGGDLQNISINWGDATAPQSIPDGTNVADQFYSHTYLHDGTYEVVISGTTLSHFGYCNTPTNFWNLTRILSWGDLNTTSLECAARSRSALTEIPSTLPSTVTDLKEMLDYTQVFDQDLSTWDTSNVTRLSRFVSGGNFTFNRSLGAWDISNVTDLADMFDGASAFGDTAYSNTLIGWAAQNVKPNLTLGTVGDSSAVLAKATGCNAIEARNTLITVANWTINDTPPTQVCTAQTVTWAPTNTAGQTGTLTPNAVATGSDLGTIRYSVLNAGTTGCSVNANSGAITAASAGTCVIRATANATTGYYSGWTTVAFAFTASGTEPTTTLVNTGGNTLGILVFALGGLGLGVVVLLVIFTVRRRKISATQSLHNSAWAGMPGSTVTR